MNEKLTEELKATKAQLDQFKQSMENVNERLKAYHETLQELTNMNIHLRTQLGLQKTENLKIQATHTANVKQLVDAHAKALEAAKNAPKLVSVPDNEEVEEVEQAAVN